MAAKTIKMEQLKLIRQLHQKGYSIKGIARTLGLSRNTVRKYVGRLKTNGEDIAAALQEDRATQQTSRYRRLIEHFGKAELELRKTGVTRQLLWLEYKERDVEGYNYSQYCYHFSEYLRHKEVVMHLNHKAGEEMMIDFAGKKLRYVERDTGKVIECEVFVSVLPFSGLVYCEAVHTQQTLDFKDCVNGMVVYYGGVPQTILCDNLKTAVTRPDKYEPVFTELCYQMSEHYKTCFSATRPYKPRDKAMVERTVNIVYQNIYALMRNRTVYSLKELNDVLRQHLEKLNNKPYKGCHYSRRDLFNETEKATLSTLPGEVFQRKKVVYATVQRNYHIQLSEDRHYYSVPYMYAGKKVKVLYDNKDVEVYVEDKRIAVHQRTKNGTAYHTHNEHMPENHQKVKQYQGWTEEELLERAERTGPHTRQAAVRILSSSISPRQNFKACYGMILLQNKYGSARLEAACQRAGTGNHITYSMIRNILQNGLDQQTNPGVTSSIPQHGNLRGSAAYQ